MTEQSEFGPTPELAWLPVGRLIVDHSYQRTLESRRSQTLIERISGDFQWIAFQAILATPKGDKWLILDGQHRAEAARLCGIKHIPAVVVKAASVGEQAAAFVRANYDRVSVNGFALYHARLVAGDKRAAATAQVATAANVMIPKYPVPADKMKPRETMALSLIGSMIDKLGDGGATAILKAVADAYPAEPGAINMNILRAVMKLYQTVPTEAGRRALLGRITEFLSVGTSARLTAKAMGRREQYGGPLYENIAALINLGIATLARRDPVAAGSIIKAPSREQLMGGR